MGVNASFAVFFDGDPIEVLKSGPRLDRGATQRLASRLLPGAGFHETGNGSMEWLGPDDDSALLGDFGELKVVAYYPLVLDMLSELDEKTGDPSLGRNTYVHLENSTVDLFSFALWRDRECVRVFCSRESDGVFEDLGERLACEKAFWDAREAVATGNSEEETPPPFEPLDFAIEILRANMGFHFRLVSSECVVDPASIPLIAFEKEKAAPRPWWRLWGS
ncbi:MAG: hypothetical protein AAGG01_18720 [Planctomycetota bacterium]